MLQKQTPHETAEDIVPHVTRNNMSHCRQTLARETRSVPM